MPDNNKPKNEKLTSKQLEHQLWMTAHIITGPIDASDYKTYIFPILFFKRINDVYNEECETAMELYGDEGLFINADEIHTKGRAQNTMSEDQADEIYNIYKRQHEAAKEIEGVSRWVPIKEIIDNDFNLNIARYVQKPLEIETITVEEALKDFKQKLTDLEQAEDELEHLLDNTTK